MKKYTSHTHIISSTSALACIVAGWLTNGRIRHCQTFCPTITKNGLNSKQESKAGKEGPLGEVGPKPD